MKNIKLETKKAISRITLILTSIIGVAEIFGHDGPRVSILYLSPVSLVLAHIQKPTCKSENHGRISFGIL
jgi:hypothetical protein